MSSTPILTLHTELNQVHLLILRGSIMGYGGLYIVGLARFRLECLNPAAKCVWDDTKEIGGFGAEFLQRLDFGNLKHIKQD
mmetsp:Transcript_45010/g.70578  ORF Transcript_45010/g.70578 Transcript_45010/m.70578 type:complete len:81 (+) Transcript_45010:493-735(+)